MNYEINCPICFEDKWLQMESRNHEVNDKWWKSGYPMIQKNVFFKIWYPNKSVVKMTRNVCKKCGFVIDLPRPNEKDINNKYEYLVDAEKHLGSSRGISPRAMRKENKQARNLLKVAESFFKNSSGKLNILDFGGGDGHFLSSMKKKGHNCYLVDYNKFPTPGINRLGDTLEDISDNRKFDLIICRHVLEHVASPKKIITNFKNYLNDESLVFAEVPIQLYGKGIPNIDPVTHINYFQADSLKILFQLAGFIPIISRQKITTYHGESTIVAQILARPGNIENNIIYQDSYEKTISIINASLFRRLKVQLVHPLNLLIIITKKITNYIKLKS